MLVQFVIEYKPYYVFFLRRIRHSGIAIAQRDRNARRFRKESRLNSCANRSEFEWPEDPGPPRGNRPDGGSNLMFTRGALNALKSKVAGCSRTQEDRCRA